MKWEYAFPATFLGALIVMFGIFFFAMHHPRYTARDAASECAASGKRLGEFSYDFGESRFTCVDAPL